MPELIFSKDFNNILIPALEKLSKENKGAYLMGDFNINLINYNSHNLISTYPEKSRKQLANLRLQKEFLHQSKSKTKFMANSAEPEMELLKINYIFNLKKVVT